LCLSGDLSFIGFFFDVIFSFTSKEFNVTRVVQERVNSSVSSESSSSSFLSLVN
jgi:hypothetical protein